MAETITLPAGIGPVKSEYVYAGGAALMGVAGYMVWSRRSAAAGEVAAVEPTATEGDYAAGIDAYDNPAHVTSGTVSTVDPSTMPPTTNSDWTSRAVEKLSDVGWEPMSVTAALSRYLNRKPLLSAAEVEIVQSATAMVGPPPQGDFSILMPEAPPPPVAGTPTPTPAAPPAAPATPSGLRLATNTTTQWAIAWNPVDGATSYEVDTHNGVVHRPSAPTFTATDFRHKTKYTVTVRAIGPGGASPWSSALTLTSK
jgi:hypothetical protein